MSRHYEHDDNSDTKDLDYSSKEKSRDVRTVDDEDYTGEALDDKTQDEKDEEWASGSQSPVAGRMSGSMEELERIQSSEGIESDEVRECLKDCLDCYQTCSETITRCLTIGGKHAKLEHLNLLMDCARICNMNADFILRISPYYPQTCGITADICDECADTCDRFGEDFMKECAGACRRCAESCRELAR